MLHPPSPMVALALIVFLAFLTEAIVGFGSTVLAVTLGAHLRDIEAILPSFVPLNILLSSLLLSRSLRLVEGRLLLTRVAPPVGLGMAAGLLLSRLQGALWLKAGFGLFVTALALSELLRLRRKSDDAAPLPPAVALPLMSMGGVIHGLFGSGGPLIVYVLSRRIADRTAMRATLAALWLTLNAVLLINFATLGKLTAATARESALLLPSLLLGLGLGNLLHHRLPEGPFRVLVYVVLLVAGGSLAARTLLQILA